MDEKKITILTFKQLVYAINNAGKGWDELNRLENLIKRSFEEGKITFNDYELLNDFIEKVCI